MNWKKIGKALLYPHIAIMVLLVPIATAFLLCSMLILGTESPISIISYVVAAYTLTVWCFKIPYLIEFIKKVKTENKYVVKWLSDTHLRIKVSLYGSLLWNALYGVLQLWLGFYHSTFWFYSLGAYYICLGLMRFFLLQHTRKYAPGEKMKEELKKYRNCGWIFLVMNLALSLIIFFMVYWNRTFIHHMITTIAMAAYTFTTFTLAIISMVKYRKYNSPVFSASKAISMAAALVSMLTLESTMLTTFSDETLSAIEQKWMLGATGGAVTVTIIVMAVYMIATGTKKLNTIKNEVTNEQ